MYRRWFSMLGDIIFSDRQYLFTQMSSNLPICLFVPPALRI